MVPITVLLNDEMLGFVRRAVSDGSFDSMDDVVARGLALVRRELMLGDRHSTEDASDETRVSFAAEVVRPERPAYAPDVATTTTGDLRPIVDLTRTGFDSPAFMSDLVGKIEKKTQEEKAAQNKSGLFKIKPK